MMKVGRVVCGDGAGGRWHVDRAVEEEGAEKGTRAFR